MSKKNLLILFLFIVIIALLFVTRCNNQKYTSDVRRFQNLVKIKDSTIERSNTEILSNQKAMKSLNDSLFAKDRKVKEVYALLQTSTRTQIIKVPVPYLETDSFSDTVYITKVNQDSFIRVPKKASFKGPGLNIGITIRKEGVVIDTLTVDDTTSIRIIKRKTGLFRHEYVVETIRTSPYVKNTSQTSFLFKPKPSVFHRIVKPLLALGLGFIIARQ
jgi:hypothetical protein